MNTVVINTKKEKYSSIYQDSLLGGGLGGGGTAGQVGSIPSAKASGGKMPCTLEGCKLGCVWSISWSEG